MNFFRNKKAVRGVPHAQYTSEPHFDSRKIRENNFVTKEELQPGPEAKKNTAPDLFDAYLSYDVNYDEFMNKRKSR